MTTLEAIQSKVNEMMQANHETIHEEQESLDRYKRDSASALKNPLLEQVYDSNIKSCQAWIAYAEDMNTDLLEIARLIQEENGGQA